MTLKSSGDLSASEINIELGNLSNTQISIGGSASRTLAGVASGAIRLPTDFYGKSNGPSGTLATIDFANSRRNYYQTLTMPTWTWSAGTQFTTLSSSSLSFSGGSYLQAAIEGPSGEAVIMFTYNPGTPDLRAVKITGSGSSYTTTGAIYTGGAFPNLANMPNSLAYGNGLYVGYSRLGSGWQHITSSNGTNWTLTGSSLGTGALNIIIWTGTEFLGHNLNGSNTSNTVYASTNGTSWSTRGSITPAGSGAIQAGGSAFGNGVYIVGSADAGSPGKIYVYRSTNNGASFSATTLSPGLATNTNGQAQVRYCGGNNWVLWCGGGSNGGVSYYSSDNGSTWSSPNTSTWSGDPYATNIRMLGKGSTVIVPVAYNKIRVSMDSGVTWTTYSISATPYNIPLIYFP